MTIAIPPAAQVVYTTAFWTSPQFIGVVVAAIVFGAQRWVGVEIDAQTQGMISMAVGWVLGWAMKWFFPGSDGRLGFTAPAAYNVPAALNVPVGEASVVTVPKPSDDAQIATVQPIDVGTQTVKVEPAKAETLHTDAEPMAVTVAPVVFPEPLPKPPKPERKSS